MLSKSDSRVRSFISNVLILNWKSKPIQIKSKTKQVFLSFYCFYSMDVENSLLECNTWITVNQPKIVMLKKGHFIHLLSIELKIHVYNYQPTPIACIWLASSPLEATCWYCTCYNVLYIEHNECVSQRNFETINDAKIKKLEE